MANIEQQIAAIKKQIAAGKVKNVFAANGKIKQLEKRLAATKWNQFLSR